MTTEVKCAECDVDITGNSEHDHDLEVCCDCIEEKYESCQHCDELYPKTDMIEIDSDEFVCDNCFGDYYTECNSCNEIMVDDDTYWSEGGDSYCNDCYYDHYTHCSDCSCEVDVDYANYNDHGESYCDDCYGDPTEVDLDSYGVVDIRLSKSFEKNKFARAVGLEIEACNPHYDELERDLYANNFEIKNNWRIVHDGSISPSGEDDVGREFVSRGGLSGDELYMSINNMTSILTREDWYVNKSCGLHVHIDARDLRARQLAYILAVAKLCEPVIYKMMPPSRGNTRWAKRIPMSIEKILRIHDEEDFIDAWYRSHGTNPSMEKYNDSRYCGVNMHSRVIHGSIEFRHHSGTLNPEKIINWIEICQSIVKAGLDLHNLVERKQVSGQSMSLSRAKQIMKIWKLMMSLDPQHRYCNIYEMGVILDLHILVKLYIHNRVRKFYDSSFQEDYDRIGFFNIESPHIETTTSI
jgi:hypothetical protein